MPKLDDDTGSGNGCPEVRLAVVLSDMDRRTPSQLALVRAGAAGRGSGGGTLLFQFD